MIKKNLKKKILNKMKIKIKKKIKKNKKKVPKTNKPKPISIKAHPKKKNSDQSPSSYKTPN